MFSKRRLVDVDIIATHRTLVYRISVFEHPFIIFLFNLFTMEQQQIISQNTLNNKIMSLIECLYCIHHSPKQL